MLLSRCPLSLGPRTLKVPRMFSKTEHSICVATRYLRGVCKMKVHKVERACFSYITENPQLRMTSWQWKPPRRTLF
jgi:hypothetical protein